MPRPSLSCQLLRQLRKKPTPLAPVVAPASRLDEWCFLFEVWRSDRRLYCSALTAADALPGFLDAQQQESSGSSSSESSPGQLASHGAWPTCFECMEVVLPGDARRAAIAGAITAISAQGEAEAAGTPLPLESQHEARVMAVHTSSGRLILLSSSLAAGSRFGPKSLPPQLKKDAGESGGSRHHLIRVAVGLGARHVLPGPKAMCPAGSLEVRTGLAFIGPDGRWLLGGPRPIAALLGATVRLLC
eukprot:TRINITY_DN10087_c0_g2_i1.p1 TRINITY_DN10087_c0_g2~~TRINITY_DN10087_c0_g2_i1.p1  ORF type:complete len:245 (-),score=57.88 TRINITY_DN10087_c0_g2_i1:134-868(-)